MKITKRGGIWFWTLGPIGGSVYIRRPAAAERKAKRQAEARKMRYAIAQLRAVVHERA